MKIIPEGSGAATKYYAQLGADAASKKLLGRPAKIKRMGFEGHSDQYGNWHLFDVDFDVSECSKITLGGLSWLDPPVNYSYIRIVLKKDGATIYDKTGNNSDTTLKNSIDAACKATYDVSGTAIFTVVIGNQYGNISPWITNITVE